MNGLKKRLVSGVLLLAFMLSFMIEAKYPVITGFLSQSVGIMQK